MGKECVKVAAVQKPGGSKPNPVCRRVGAWQEIR